MSLLFRLKLYAISHAPKSLARWWLIPRWRADVEQTGEPELLELRNLLRLGDYAIDVGSNVGSYAYELSRVTGRVLALEPNPNLAKLIRRAGLSGVVVEQIAASDVDGEAELHVPAGGAGHMVASLRSEVVAKDRNVISIKVPTRRLDSMNLVQVAFIKIDVEGFEEHVLRGAKELLRRDHPMLLVEIEEQHNPGGVNRVRRWLAEFGYTGFFLQRGEWRSIAEFDVIRDQDLSVFKPGVTARSANGKYVNNFLFRSDE